MEKSVIDKINNSGYKFYFAITGGGTSFLGEYIGFGGASKALMGALIPYSKEAFDSFINCKIDSYSSGEGARKLALASYNKCVGLGANPVKAMGFGVSCSLAAENERAGRKHKINIAVHTYDTTTETIGVFEQGRPRLVEEGIVNELIYAELARMSIGLYIPHKFYLNETETLESEASSMSDELINFNNSFELASIHKHKEINGDTVVVYPGSFNPIHDGHRSIIHLSSQILNSPVLLEITSNNTDKGRLDYIELARRLKNVYPYDYILTNASFIRDKALILRNKFPYKKLIFVVGEDTWKRIWDPKCCTNGSLESEERNFRNMGIQFLVFARHGDFEVIRDENGYGWGEKFRIKNKQAENFRMDISSSEIRKIKL